MYLGDASFDIQGGGLWGVFFTLEQAFFSDTLQGQNTFSFFAEQIWT